MPIIRSEFQEELTINTTSPGTVLLHTWRCLRSWTKPVHHPKHITVMLSHRYLCLEKSSSKKSVQRKQPSEIESGYSLTTELVVGKSNLYSEVVDNVRWMWKVTGTASLATVGTARLGLEPVQSRTSSNAFLICRRRMTLTQPSRAIRD
jgi:hypothetical protein